MHAGRILLQELVIPMMDKKLSGLIAATYTPFDLNGSVNLDVIDSVVEYRLPRGITGLYVCGSTGEGMSLSTAERMAVAEGYVRAAQGRVPVIVQVGHNSVEEAKQLSAHAQQIGADMISATCPSYFKVASVRGLMDCMAEVAGGAPDLPFYYYHIPALTGSAIDVVDFMSHAGDQIPNLIGLKYTDTKLFEFQECVELDQGRYDVVWGCDEMLLGALATGAKGAIGSTYNTASPLYQRVVSEFEGGNLEEARRLQSLSVKMIRTMNRYPFHSAMKAVLGMQGLNMGECRLPQGNLADHQASQLRDELEAIDFFTWSN